ncbi:MAG: signal recognition particle-docking protein FtsY [Nitrospirae bacterium GWA2_42_11]|nr:MAG: signal recognition particle-docking protein FtsY [Nitrospirae bacterium GWA2_42_11]HAS17686.1 signal recognition particle-docking protein FtsY [Nitrospiraceae bacterium]
MNFFTKLSNKLIRTKDKLVGNIDSLLTRWKKADPILLEELEEILISSDTGAIVAERLIEKVKKARGSEPEDVKDALKEEMLNILTEHEGALKLPDARPAVVLIIGVNGTGKTTTIGKLSDKLRGEGKKVIIAAADTFRAAAIEQLTIWGERSGAAVIRHSSGADPAAVVFDALAASKARGVDVLIVDTAGRLHTKINLMEELKKIRRILEREHPGSPHEVLLVLDATAGQNSLVQARIFSKDIGITGIVLTKLDGTAKGGIILSISEELRIPIKMIGVGEGIEDLRDFNAREFVDALFESN